MKTRVYFIFISVMGFCLLSCSDDDKWGRSIATPDPVVILTKNSTQEEKEMNAGGTYWTIKCEEGGKECLISDKTIKVFIEDNRNGMKQERYSEYFDQFYKSLVDNNLNGYIHSTNATQLINDDTSLARLRKEAENDNLHFYKFQQGDILLYTGKYEKLEDFNTDKDFAFMVIAPL